jgi:hypothetical protein
MNELAIASGRKLVASTAIAALSASVILTTVVLPAEYGIDPTGIGGRLGILGMSTAASTDVDEEEPPIVTEATAPTEILPVATGISALNAVWKQAAPYRNDQLSVTLAPDEGAEIKAAMHTGERFVFTWVAEGGVVNFDMHGDMTGAQNGEFTSYWKGRAAKDGHGAFTAPFDGIHGWYWRNRGTQPVTVTVKTSGFYEKLYRP